jgi:hypothetical protein
MLSRVALVMKEALRSSESRFYQEPQGVISQKTPFCHGITSVTVYAPFSGTLDTTLLSVPLQLRQDEAKLQIHADHGRALA